MASILIVDDEKDNLEALHRLLRGEYEVTTVTDPFDALRQLQSKTFNVIVSDQRMPQLTGVELLEKAKKLAPMSTRILLTGYTDVESVIEAINRGNIYRYIAKPWDPADLKLTIRQANEAFLLRKELEDKNVALTESNQELKAALDELKTLDKAKAKFMSLASHELNTPLTVLTSFVQMLSGNIKGLPGEIQKMISSMQGATDRFSEIIKEILAYVQLEGVGRLDLSSVAFSKIVDRVQAATMAKIKEKNLSLVREKEAGLFVNADEEKLFLALTKILEDTILRAPKGSTIQLKSKGQGSELVFEISRTGEPWSEAAFKPFETASSQMHHQKNLGLALATAKLIIDHHHGDLEVDSKAPTLLRLRLALAKNP